MTKNILAALSGLSSDRTVLEAALAAGIAHDFAETILTARVREVIE